MATSRQHHGPVLVGRAHELRRLDEHLTRAGAGDAQTVVVSGEAGAGKSVLLDATRCRARERGFLVLAASGLELEQELPYAALHALIAPVLRTGRVPEPIAAALDGPLGVRDRPVPMLATGQALLSLVSDLAAERPVAIVLDDAQWMDPASLQTLLFVAHRLDADAAVIVIARRTGVSSVLDGVSFTGLEIGGIDETAAVELLAGHAIAPAVARHCHELTGGNPLALVEGAALLDADQRSGRTELPPVWPIGGRLLEHFAARVAGLPDAARLALAVAALEPTGDRSVIDAAVRRLGGDPQALATAEVAGVVRSGEGAVVWRHPLVAAAVLRELPAPRRRELHRALGAGDPARLHPDRIAWHLAEGASGPDEALAARLEEIGRRRTEQGAFESAARAYERAADLSEDRGARGRRLLLAAHRLLAAARVDDIVVRLAPLVDTCDDPLLAADLARLLGQAELWSLGTRAATLRLSRHASRVEQISPERSALLLGHAVVAQLLGLVPDAAHTTARQALGILERRGVPPDEHQLGMQALEVICAVLAGNRRGAPGELDAMAQVFLALLDAGWPDAAALLHVCAQAMLAEDGHEHVLELAERSVRRAEQIGMGGREMLLRLLRAECLWRLGRWSESLAEVSLVISIDEAAGATRISSLARCQVARVEAGLGLAGRCRSDAAAAIDAAIAHGQPFVEAQARAALLLLALSEGDHAGAVGEVERLTALTAGAPHPGWLWWQADAVEALHGAGHTDAARTQLTRLVDMAERTGSRWAASAGERCRAAVGLADPVPACTRALAGFQEIGARFDEARTLLLRGELRRQAGDAGGPGDLSAATALFDRLGAMPWRARAARPTAVDTPLPLSASLSAAELRVAHAVGRGWSNREVADELYLSIKTVESHLRSIYRKLDLRRRTQLVMLMSNSEPRVFPDP